MSENLHEKLIEVPSVDLDQIKSQLNDIGFEVEKEGETLFGNIHFQLRLKGNNFNAEDLRDYANRLRSFTEVWYESGIPITYNIGLDDKFNITCGMDIHKKSVSDDVDEALFGKGKEIFAKAFLDINDEDDLLNHIKEVTSYDETLGKSLMKINKEGGSVAYRAKKMSDLLTEELKDEDGWGETIPDNLENTFEELESLMYEIRNARRGAYAGFGNKVSDLVNELNRLSDRLSTDADMIEINQDKLNETVDENCSDKDEDCDNELVDDDKNELIDNLQEALAKSAKLENDNLSLQEQLSVCIAKEKKLNEELAKSKKALAVVSDSVKNVNSLKESLDEKDDIINSNNKTLKLYKSKLAAIKNDNSKQKLEESLKDSSDQVKNLTKQLEDTNNKLVESKKLVNKYASLLRDYKNSYIKSQSQAYGIDESSIKNNLKESYSIKDINVVCEKLYEDKLNLSKLPFRLNENSKFNFKQSKNEYITKGLSNIDDDYVSENLLRMLDN